MHTERIILPTGERLPMLLDDDRMPIVGPCEWMLVRRHRALNTLYRNMIELMVFYIWLQIKRIDWFDRIRSGQRFAEAELTSLTEHLRRVQQRNRTVVKLAVTPDSANKRLITVRKYGVWCFNLVISNPALSDARRAVIAENREQFVQHLLEAMQKPEPPKQSGKKGLTDKQAQFLQDVLDPSGTSAFGRDKFVKFRNYLAMCLMLFYGLRPGEVLSLRIHDVEFGGITNIRVTRRGPSLSDTRSRPARVKRAGRILPIDSPLLARQLDDYCMEHRERFLRHGKVQDSGYLFLSDEGDPLAGSTLERVFIHLRQRYPDDLPATMTAKSLRHTFSNGVRNDLRGKGHTEGEITNILMWLRGDTSPSSQDVYIDYQQAGRAALARYHLSIANNRNVADVPF